MRPILNVIAATFGIMVVVYFLRFWQDTRDRFFLLFAVAFAVLASHWMLLATMGASEHAPAHYLLRVVGFLLILAAIVHKNRG